jgi:hypothetical protein
MTDSYVTMVMLSGIAVTRTNSTAGALSNYTFSFTLAQAVTGAIQELYIQLPIGVILSPGVATILPNCIVTGIVGTYTAPAVCAVTTESLPVQTPAVPETLKYITQVNVRLLTNICNETNACPINTAYNVTLTG